MIEEWRGEGSQESVMGDLDFDPVKSCLDCVARAHRKATDHRLDIILVHRLGIEVAGRLGHLSRRPHDVRRMFERCVTAMGELAKNACAMLMDGVGDFTKRSDDRWIPSIHKPSRHFPGRMNCLAFEYAQSDAAASTFF